MSLSDLFMETFAMESTLLRCQNIAASGNSAANDIARSFSATPSAECRQHRKMCSALVLATILRAT